MTRRVNAVIPGPVVPYTRVGRERWTDRARRYLGWRDAFALDLSATVSRPYPVFGEGVPVEVHVTFARHVRRGDLDNLLKGVLDASEGILFANDRQVTALSARRVQCESGLDLTGVTVWAADTLAGGQTDRGDRA